MGQNKPPKWAKPSCQTQTVRIAPAPLKEGLDFATFHKPLIFLGLVAGTTGLEPATSAVTGQRSNQLSYVPRLFFNNLVIRHIESSVSQLSLFSPFSIISLLWTQFLALVDTKTAAATTRSSLPEEIAIWCPPFR